MTLPTIRGSSHLLPPSNRGRTNTAILPRWQPHYHLPYANLTPNVSDVINLVLFNLAIFLQSIEPFPAVYAPSRFHLPTVPLQYLVLLNKPYKYYYRHIPITSCTRRNLPPQPSPISAYLAFATTRRNVAENTATARRARSATYHSIEAVYSCLVSICPSDGDGFVTLDSKLGAVLPHQLVDMNLISRPRVLSANSPRRLFLQLGILLSLYQCTIASTNHSYLENWQARFIEQSPRRDIARRGPPSRDDDKVPLVITNRCDTAVWPGTATQAGLGPGTGGFQLQPGESKNLTVGSN